MKLLGLSVVLGVSALTISQSTGANPIRRVVNMLQAMEKKVREEGEKEEDLFEAFQCYCKNGSGDLTKSIKEANAKIAQLETQVAEDTAAKAQLDEELVQHKKDRKDAQESLAAATKQREKDRAIYEKESGDTGTNIAALGKAIKAIETGLGGGAFLQTEAGAVLKRLVMSFPQLSELDRQSVTAFLTGSAAAPGTSEIVGILKEMKDEMDRDLSGLNSAEEQAQKQFDELASAKKKEIAAATKAIEEKTQRSGELAVKIVQGKDDLEDTQSAMAEDEQFKANLARDCETKKKEFNDRVKLRAEELQALAETIKVLNDDDALDLFKKAIPTPGESFLQEDSTMKTVVKQATDALRAVKKTFNNPQIDFISLALKGKKVDFSKVLKLIDDLVATLGEEQKNDDEHKDYCNAEFDTSDDKKKSVQRDITAQQHAEEEAETQSKNLAAEIKALQEGIAALDKSVAEATEQRKKENAEFVQTSAENNAALKLLDFAKNRLNKFYNPKLYKPPPERQLSEEERIYSNMGGELEPTPAPGGIAGTGVAVFLQTRKAAPAPPPDTWGAYEKKGSQSTGVIAMIDMLANDLKKDTQAAEFEEKDAQEEYEELMADSKKKRAADSKSITTKETAKAEADEAAETAKENLASSNAELKATNEYIENLHGECDFLLENYDFRKTARAEEVDALKKAKAVLNGADYSFLQTTRGFLA